MELCTGIEKELDKLRNEVVNVKTKLERTDNDCPLPSTLSTVLNEDAIEANIIAHLAFIEEKVSTVLQQYNKTTSSSLSSSPSVGIGMASKVIDQSEATTYSVAVGIGPHATIIGQDLLHIIPPKLEDYSSGEEEGNRSGGDRPTRPLTHLELREKTSIVKARQRGRKVSTGIRSQRTG